MSVIDADSDQLAQFNWTVSTEAATDDSLAGSIPKDEKNRLGWQRMIDDFLIEWGRNPQQLQEDDIDAPTVAAIQKAIDIARKCRDNGVAAPLRVVPDGEGGIAFECHDGDYFLSLDIFGNGLVELATFRDCRLESRVLVPRGITGPKP